MSTLEKLQNIIRDVLDDESLTITRETTASDIEDWDSLSNINIIVSCENEFGIKFKMEESLQLKSIGDFIDTIESKI